MKIDSKILQLVIIIGLVLLMAIALIIDGQMGERVMAVLLSTFGFICGYFFRKAKENV